MRRFRTVVFVVLVTSGLIFFLVATMTSNADPLPPGLPSWFKELDKNHDGQVSLREWLRGGKRPADFRHHDLNGDGFITPNEVLPKVKKVQRLDFARGRINYQGTIGEATDERYEGKKTFRIFTIRLEEGKTYQIEEVSDVFYAFLYLEDPNGNIVEEDNSGGRGLTVRIVHQAAETGTYRIIATSQDGVKTGDFVLSIRVVHDSGGSLSQDAPAWFKKLDTNHDGQVSLQEWVQGGNDPDDFLLFDLNDDGFITVEEILQAVKKVQRLELVRGRLNYHGAIEEATEGRYQGKKTFKIFTIKLERDKTYQIEEVSDVFYAYLYLEDPSGNVVEEHNSGGVGLTARLVHQAAQTGIYRLIATSQDGVRTGEFALSIRVVHDSGDSPPRDVPAWFKELDKNRDGQVSLQEWVRGGYDPDDFLLFDLNDDGFITAEEVLLVVKKVQHLEFVRGRVNYRGAIEEATDERYQGKKTFKIFTIKLEEGKTYRIEEVSQVFHAYLYLEDPSGNIVGEHNSGGRGQTARIVHQAAETGIYRLIATSQDGVKTGDFALSIDVVHGSGGSLPKGLPPWFKELDTNHDGQVSLREWLQGGYDPDDFLLYDLNGDGFVTPNEVLQYLKSRSIR